MLKLCPMEMASILNHLFKKILHNDKFPDIWKMANVQPVNKKNNRQQIKNYHPISLLPICSKLFEKFLFDQMYKFFTNNGLISSHQSGFKPGDSTVYQLLSIVESIYQSFEDFCETRALFLDLSKAFDIVWHAGLNKN